MSLPTSTMSNGSAHSSTPNSFQHFLEQRMRDSMTSCSPTSEFPSSNRKRPSSSSNSVVFLDTRPCKRSCPDPLSIDTFIRVPLTRTDSGFHSMSPVSPSHSQSPLPQPKPYLQPTPPSPRFWTRPIIKPAHSSLHPSQRRNRSPSDEEIHQAVKGPYALPDVTILSLTIDICQRYDTLDLKLSEWYERELKPTLGPEYQGNFTVDAKWILVQTTRAVLNDWLLDGLYNYEEREWFGFGKLEMESWLGPSVRTGAFFRSLIITLWRSQRAHLSRIAPQKWEASERDIQSQTQIPSFAQHVNHIRTWISQAVTEGCCRPVAEMMPDLPTYVSEIISKATASPSHTPYETRTNGLLALTKIANALCDAEGEVGENLRASLLPAGIDLVEGMMWITNCMSTQERIWVRDGNFRNPYFHELMSLKEKAKDLKDNGPFRGLWVVVKELEGAGQKLKSPVKSLV